MNESIGEKTDRYLKSLKDGIVLSYRIRNTGEQYISNFYFSKNIIKFVF